MKKSILKSVVSVFAAATMLITSANLVLAENDYMSYSNDFSSATGVTVNSRVNGDGKTGDIVVEVTDGVLKNTRYRYNMEDGSKAESGKASIVFDKSFSAGKVQAEFDFETDNVNRAFLVSFDGYQTKADSGLLIYSSNARLVYPNGSSFSEPVYYNEDQSQWIEANEGYTLTVTLDIASAMFDIKLVKISDPTQVKTFKISIPDDKWGSATKNAVTGLSIWTLRAQDTANGTMIFDNLSVDAYTETNYEVNSIYRSTDGLETNKKMDGYTFKGLTVSKLTNIPAPANASFITASYDGSGRMINAVANKLSELGSTPVNADVEGNTVKSFVLDMSNANPLMPVYQHGSATEPTTTVRKVDFDEGFVTPPVNNSTWGKFDMMTTYGIYYHMLWPGVAYTQVTEGDNKALKVERSTFRYTEDGSKVHFSYNTANGEWKTEAENGNNHFILMLGGETNSAKISFKFKFAGSENATQTQRMDIKLDNTSLSNSTKIIGITRNQSGAGGVSFGTTGCSWTDMKANEWYTFTAEITSAGAFTCSVAGNFDSGYAVKKGSSVNAIDTASYLSIGSPRDGDIVPRNQEIKTPTSVWYIDDVVVEY